VRVEEFVGRRIREVREAGGMSQEEFGRAIGPLLGKPWARQAVSNAELGNRAFTAAELVAVAAVTGVSVARLLTPPPDVAQVEMPTGQLIDRAVIADEHVPGDPVALREIATAARSVEVAAMSAQATVDRVTRAAKTLAEQLDAAVVASAQAEEDQP